MKNFNTNDLMKQLKGVTDLGHCARNESFFRQVNLACSSQGTPLTQSAGKKDGKPMSAAVSLYRFLDNEQISIDQLREIRREVVLNLLPTDDDIVVVHDVSLLDYSRHESKEDRRPIGNKRGKGYEYHACIAVNPRTSRIVGVLHDTLINGEGPDDKNVMDYDYESLFEGFSEEEHKHLQENHRHQMAVHVNGLNSILNGRRVIHVADREFDDIFILNRCRKNVADYVIRSSGDRNVSIPEFEGLPVEVKIPKQTGHPLEKGWVCVSLKRLSQVVPMNAYKSLPLDSRGRVTSPKNAVRTAHLSIGAMRVRLYRTAQRNNKYFLPPEPIDVNVVVIREIGAPDGVTPLCWVLFTSLPVNTLEQMRHVGKLYELRWSVEEFYRLLKSGYNIESYRVDDADKTARLIVILTLAALVILGMKEELGLPSKGPLDEANYGRVIQAMEEANNSNLNLNLRLFAYVARIGGWLARKRDPIGPAVLMRGILQIIAIMDAFNGHRDLFEEALKNPEAVREFLGWFGIERKPL